MQQYKPFFIILLVELTEVDAGQFYIIRTNTEINTITKGKS